MSEPEKLTQVILNIRADGDLSQAEADALLHELEAEVSKQMAGSVEIISKQSPEESQSKGEPLMTLAIVVIQYVVPKLIEIVFDMIKERRNSQVRAFAKVGGEQITLDSRTDLVEFQEIQNRVQAANTGDEVPERRFALLIGSTSYQDTRLNQLASPEVDIQALEDILRDPGIGGYDDVNLLLNQSSLAISQAVEQFFKKKASTDLLLLYFSGHGVRDEDDELYLAAQNTDIELLRATAIPSNFIKILMDRSKSERQVLILDCCYSGSFLHGSKGVAAVDVPVHAARAFKGNGFGRVVLTATDKTQLAWEGQRIMGQAQKSVFTEHLIQGLKSGEADQDRDGWIALDELYKYVFNRMVKTPGQQNQTPEMNVFNMKGNIILARNPKPKPMELPPELQSLIVHPYADVRLAAVGRLKELFDSSQYGLALAARKGLESLSTDDSRMVSEAAGRVLGMIPSEKSDPPEVSEPPRGSGAAVPTPPSPAPRMPAADSPRQGVPVSPGVAWWTQIKPVPGARSGGGTKSGPTLVEQAAAKPGNTGSVTMPGAANLVSRSSTPVYPALQTPPAQKTSSLQEPDTVALIAGVLSLLLIFLPVSIWGFVVGLRALRTTSNSPRAAAGLVLSSIAIAIQILFLLIYVLF